MGYLSIYYKKRLKRVEQNLFRAGFRKCRICGIWGDKNDITKNLCDECERKERRKKKKGG